MQCEHYANGKRCPNKATHRARFEATMSPGSCDCEVCAQTWLDEYAQKLDDGHLWDAVPIDEYGQQIEGRVLRGNKGES